MQEREFDPRETKAEDDAASDTEEEHRTDSVNQVRRLAAKMEQGSPGYCDACGDHFDRVVPREVKGERLYLCGRDRDRLKTG